MPSEAPIEPISTTPDAPKAAASSDQHPAGDDPPGAVISKYPWVRLCLNTLDDLEKIETLYNELLLAVASKHEGETRHETALRYILEREEHCGGPDQDNRNVVNLA